MKTLRRFLLSRFIQYSDLLLTVASFFAAHIVTHPRFGTGDFLLGDLLPTPHPTRNIVVFLLILVSWNFIFSRFDLYRTRRFSSLATEIVDIAKIQWGCVAVVFVASILLNEEKYRGVFIIAFWGFATLGMLLTRLGGRYLLKQARRHGRNLRFILVVGINRRSIRFFRRIDARTDLGYRVIGFADNPDRDPLDYNEKHVSRVTTIEGLPDFLRSNPVDEVIICLPLTSFYKEASAIVSTCERQGILVRYFLSDVFDVQMVSTRTDSFEGEPLVTLYTGFRKDFPVLVKNTIDFSLSLFLIVLLSPVMAAAAAAIKLSSPGPVFFIQERLGLNKRIFRIFKFRTMIEGAEKLQDSLEDRNEVDGPVFKIKDDPRITRVGRLLRKTSVDELPQLFNVFNGDMSLVGPRPLPVRDYNGFSEDFHRRRFSVRPGITCLWQVTGRSNVSFEKWMELDIEYIDKWSLSLDLKILWKTIPAVFRGHGAV